MKFKELKAAPESELKAKLSELRKELVKAYAQVATGTVPKSPGQIKTARKTIARILTILRGRKDQ